MKVKSLIMVSAWLTAAAGALMFSACGDDEVDEPPLGEPKISYYVVGTVTNAEGTPLPNITMSVKEDFMNAFGYVLMADTLTDAQGQYRTKVFRDATLHEGLVVMAEDPEGVYASDTLDLTQLSKKKVLSGDDMMDKGTWELTGNFVLKLRQ